MASVEKFERNVMNFFYIFNYNCNYFNIKNIYALKFLYFSSQNISKFAKNYFKTQITIIVWQTKEIVVAISPLVC